MTYQTTETINGTPTSSTSIWTVTGHTDAVVSLADGGTSSVSYSIVTGNYIPTSESYVLPVDYGAGGGGVYNYNVTDTYSSSTPLCAPPGVGEQYDYTTWVPGPVSGTGDYIAATMTVSSRIAESLSLPSGSFSATKLIMTKTGGRADSTVTRYLAEGIGVVMEVESIPSTNTTITKELVTYSYQ